MGVTESAAERLCEDSISSTCFTPSDEFERGSSEAGDSLTPHGMLSRCCVALFAVGQGPALAEANNDAPAHIIWISTLSCAMCHNLPLHLWDGAVSPSPSCFHFLLCLGHVGDLMLRTLM
jgi:hypothetical protein